MDAMPVLTEDNFDDFLNGLFDPNYSREVFSVDLMAANPDVAKQVTAGGFTVSVYRTVFEDVELYAAMADDGCLVEHEAPEDWIEFAENEPEARAIADRFIMDWKHAWGLALS